MIACPICNNACALFDVVDFNKSCEEAKGKFLNLSGVPVYYAACHRCGFCYAPELMGWSPEDFAKKIYNAEYVLVDPDYIDARPRAVASTLLSMFEGLPSSVRHLDYGGGSGLLSQILREANWDSMSYDPFVDKSVCLEDLGKFNFITAFEVFEHVPDVRGFMINLTNLLSCGGVILFSTLLSDGNIRKGQRLSWWYASPRNGHISLFSKESLSILANDHGLNFISLSHGFHVFFTSLPPWAERALGGRA